MWDMAMNVVNPAIRSRENGVSHAVNWKMRSRPPSPTAVGSAAIHRLLRARAGRGLSHTRALLDSVTREACRTARGAVAEPLRTPPLRVSNR